MKVDYQDKGAIATITITSTVFEFRKHNRVIDAVLFAANVKVVRSGLFLMKSVISGPSTEMLRAYKTVVREAAI
ncbi:hypothetical protein J5069_07580 [Candidatus Symbiopectobacterium sp. NZEC127]|uniref:hypothetical protein n=1 Tax=Candidatus Symbiopectobacterium sp. NZEC127 TaxID=2820472 RepID=UPI002226BAA1|nr:hypothetical protein [Candidatus Symbiopectobacterium sp. NZEC127]MCW2485757.1 hypothetical protein [Candidatus Symbiopectobacterium sp. NZEC127]